MTAERGYRAHLDGLRAVAVILVILFHLGFLWIPGGFIGVDVFFVISGYLITGLLLGEVGEHSRVRMSRFYARRIRRLLPASAVVLVVVMGLAVWLLDAVDKSSVGHDATASALYVANWHFISSGADYFTPGDVPSPLIHFWSLAVEEQFYLVWPALFYGLWRLSTRRNGPAATGRLLAAILVLGAISAVLSVVMVPSTAAYYGTETRAYQLLAGAALAVIGTRFGARVPDTRAVRTTAAVAAAAAFGALIGLATSIPDSIDYPGTAGLAVTAASVVLIAALDLTPAGLPQRLFGSRLPAGVGRMSYSLYLWHWPIIVFGPLIAEELNLAAPRERGYQVVAILLAAAASYFLIERPVRFKLWKPAPAMAVVSTGLALSLAVAVVGIPLLQPRDPFAVNALAAVSDLAKPGNCPYFREQWGPPDQSEPCLYRKGGKQVVALVGDSHAQQWQPAFDAMAERHDLTLVRVTRRGCPANTMTVYTLDSQGLSHADEPCSQWRSRVYERLVEEYDPDLIYVETRSHEWGIKDGDRDVGPNDPGHLAIWTRGWDRTLDTLTSGTGKVVVSTTLPNIAWKVPACLAEAKQDVEQCDMPLSRDSGVAPYNKVIAGLPRRFADVTVVDPTPIVCPDEVCRAVIDNVVVHRDDDHISATFARDAAGRFETMLYKAGVRF